MLGITLVALDAVDVEFPDANPIRVVDAFVSENVCGEAVAEAELVGADQAAALDSLLEQGLGADVGTAWTETLPPRSMIPKFW